MHRHGLTWVAILAIVIAMFLTLPPMVARQDSVLSTYRALVEVDALAHKRYVEVIEDERLVDGAIRGMMLQLDPYSGYIAPDELIVYQERSVGKYIGVGVGVGIRDRRPMVISPVEGSPASLAGVLPGDFIVSIDGQSAKGRSVFDIEQQLRGKPGSPVRLTVVHAGRHEPDEIILLRAPVSVRTVRGFRRSATGKWQFMIDPIDRIGYVRVNTFLGTTMTDFDSAIAQLADQDMTGLILDLRFNPGGLMDQAVEMVDRFVTSGVILSTVTRRLAVREFSASPDATMPRVLLAVLINGGSASSAEIVAGSLQDHGRAVIVGERTFGKGSVQHLIQLESHDAAIKLTVAHYRLPGGRIIHRTPANQDTDRWGVLPDVKVVLNDDEVKAIQESRRWLDGAFDGHAPTHPQKMNGNADSDAGPAELVRDRQLTTALSLIRERVAANHLDAD